MIYLLKKISKDYVSSKPGLQDLNEYFKVFGVNGFIRYKNYSRLQKLLYTKPIILSDLIASIIATLFKEEHIKRKDFAKMGLRCCRDMLMDFGFEEVNQDSIKNLFKDAKKNIIFAAGCQTEEILESRVNAVDKLSYAIAAAGYSVEIFFSGRNPRGSSKDRVKIQNESTRMVSIFYERLRRWNIKRDISMIIRIEKIYAESESNKTGDNIKKLFKKRLKVFKDDNTNLFIISSNFHLLKIFFEIESQLKKEKNLKIKNIVLIGAEPIITNYVTMNPIYIKSMCFEITKSFISKDEFFKIIK